jgi:hypothetical protein
VTEHLAPYLPDFPYDPRDVRFLGAPVDLIIFDGMTENDLRKIVFLEVKTGSSGLSRRERKIRDAIQEGRVSWREFRLPKPGSPDLLVEDSNEMVEANEGEELRMLEVEVSQQMIDQNVLILTEYIEDGTIGVGEILNIEAAPSGDRFATVADSNKLREGGGKIAKFYRDAEVTAGDIVLLTEVTPGNWYLER